MEDYRNYTGPPPSDIKVWGADNVCDIDHCPLDWTLLKYRPSLAANAFFLAAFGLLNIVHVYLGFRWRSWGFMIGMTLGCTAEVIGYVGRIMLWNDPFSYTAFMIQIVCLGTAPVFYTASIYVTLSKAIIFFAPEYSRFKPQLFYWIFIPLDVVCLLLQAAGGTMSSESEGDDDTGVDISMAGLILQVIVIMGFIVAFADYMARYLRSGKAQNFGWRVKAFFAGLSIAVMFILGRCAYRVAELREGYEGELVTHEPEFIALEGVFIVIACVALLCGHPGLGFKRGRTVPTKERNDSEESGLPMAQPRVRWPQA